MLSRSRCAVVLLLALALHPFAFGQGKPLDPSTFDTWRTVQGTTLSTDGHWIAYMVNPQEGDGILEIQELPTGKKYTVERGSGYRFSKDNHFLITTVLPKFEDTRKAKKDKAKPEDMPKNALVVLNLATGEQTKIDKVTSFTLPKEDSGWFVYRPEPPKPPPADKAKPAASKTPAAKEAASTPDSTPKKPTKKDDDKPGSDLVLRNLQTGKEERIENVVNWAFPKDGTVLAYTLSTKDGAGDGVVWYDLATGRKLTAMSGMGHYPKLALQDKDKLLSFITDKDDYASKKPLETLNLFDPKSGKSSVIAKAGMAEIPKNWTVNDSNLSFSEAGKRLIFGTYPKPEEDPKDDKSDDEKVSVDIWSWTDPQLMPAQLLGADKERNRSYTAVYNISAKKVVQLGTADMPDVQISRKGDGDVALGSSGLPYQKEVSWDTDYQDYYVVNPNTGAAKKVLSHATTDVSLSPDGRFILAYNPEDRAFSSIDTRTLAVAKIGRDIKAPLYDEENDVPASPGPYGQAGWTRNDQKVLLYDNFDIWSVDPQGKEPSRCLTGGYGRGRNIAFRYVDLDPEQEFIPDGPMLLSSFQRDTKDAGFYRLRPDSSYPEKLVLEPKVFSAPSKAKNADVIAFLREDFAEPRDLWVTNSNFDHPTKLTSLNPQQAQYNWGTSELVRWVSADGVPLEGVLYKPQNFDITKKYPMVVYYYERSSDMLHRYFTPAPSPSTINISYFVSNGYVVFMPDIVYRVGYPGESALHCILPGILSILEKGYVDPKRIGLQGHSWGGYETAYLVTQSTLFKCACAGAPVSDMISAYGGIRWGAGISREFQYEKTQSRIGGTLWDKPMQFIENSPIYYADKVQAPLLMMANDKDGAVPWYQGIELFSALRRLNKPAWLVVYNGEDHNLVQRKNRKDWSMRMQQFFDHYLKDEPMPVWMAKGVPATMKGRTYGFELVH